MRPWGNLMLPRSDFYLRVILGKKRYNGTFRQKKTNFFFVCLTCKESFHFILKVDVRLLSTDKNKHNPRPQLVRGSCKVSCTLSSKKDRIS